MNFWMDGKLLHSIPVETKPSKLVYFDPYSEEQMRLFLPEGDHVFRAAFLDDEFVKEVARKASCGPRAREMVWFCDLGSGSTDQVLRAGLPVAITTRCLMLPSGLLSVTMSPIICWESWAMRRASSVLAPMA